MESDNYTEKNEDAIVEQSTESIKKFLLKKNLWIFLGLVVLLILAWQIRTANIPGLKDITTNQYTLGPDLDPYVFLRYMKMIVENRSLPEIDSMRYVPLGYDTSQETVLLPYMMAYFHKILSVFSPVSIEYSAVIFPAFMFLLTVLIFFLFIRKTFEDYKYKNIVAFIATAFLIVSTSLLPRTIAGIPEKESVGFLFLFLSFYLFLCAWKSEKTRKSIILSFLAGISTILMALVWGGVIYVFMVIAAVVFLEFLFDKIEKKEIYTYSVWILSSVIILALFSERFTFAGLATSISSGFALVVLALLLTDRLIFNTNIKNIKAIESLRKKIPDRIISLIISVAILAVISSILFGINFVPDFVKEHIGDLTNPYTDRHSLTVAENRQPYFDEWKTSFGPEIKGFPIVFWLFAFGSILLFYRTIENFGKKTKIILTSSYVLFFIVLVFSRYSSASIMNGTSGISQLVFFSGFLVFVLAWGYVYYKHYKEENLAEFKRINSSYLFLIIYFIIGLVGARSAIRLIMGLVPSVVAVVGYFSVFIIDKARKQKEETLKFIYWILAILVAAMTVYAFMGNPLSLTGGWNNFINNQPGNLQITSNYAKAMVPSAYNQQWQKAMAWVRGNTDENSVFGHWWDYGYWVQTIGNRATIGDGGNAVGYWNYLMGRHGLTAQSEEEALNFLYAHNTSYFLIDSTDIGKYGAYSSIGSDENYDRYSWIGTFILNEQATQEKQSETSYYYQGGISLDEDFVWKDENGQVFFPAKNSGVGALILKVENETILKQPEAIFVYQNKQINVPLRYAYFKGRLYDFNSGYLGGLYIFSKVEQKENKVNINDKGAALFLSERNMRALWVRLYLLGEANNFRLVHTQSDFVVENLKNQGADVEEIIYFNGIRGPIKIWEIIYPSSIKFDEKYISTDYPDSVRLAKT